MPQVGVKHFPYTPAGERAAKSYAKATGEKVRMKKRYSTALGYSRPVRDRAAPNPNAPVGQGGRFAALKNKLSNEKGIKNPGALAASIGRKKYGASRFNKMAANGR